MNHPVTRALWEKLGSAPSDWLRSPDGRRMIAKALLHVRCVVGRKEARELHHLLRLAAHDTL